MFCVNKIIKHSIDKINQTISNVYIVSDGCAAQFCSRFVLNFLIFFQKDVSPEWHYNEAHHGKDPMDGIGSTIKNLVYCKKLSGDVAIDTLKKFPKFANEISNADCMFLSKEQLLKEPEEVTKAAPTPTTLKIHKVKRVKEENLLVNNIYYLSEDLEPLPWTMLLWIDHGPSYLIYSVLIVTRSCILCV